VTTTTTTTAVTTTTTTSETATTTETTSETATTSETPTETSSPLTSEANQAAGGFDLSDPLTQVGILIIIFVAIAALIFFGRGHVRGESNFRYQYKPR
jgi:hypothetical protein